MALLTTQPINSDLLLPNAFPIEEIAQQHANRLMATARQFYRRCLDIAVEEVVIGWRPLPLDGHPVIGPSPAAPTAISPLCTVVCRLALSWVKWFRMS